MRFKKKIVVAIHLQGTFVKKLIQTCFVFSLNQAESEYFPNLPQSVTNARHNSCEGCGKEKHKVKHILYRNGRNDTKFNSTIIKQKNLYVVNSTNIFETLNTWVKHLTYPKKLQ